jgi:DNA invertase Pin-like site-specific DNA recombinase
MKAVAYMRTSSSENVGEDRDSLPRQQRAIGDYARRNNLEIIQSAYDPAVSGTDMVFERPGFKALVDWMLENSIQVMLVENASRLARQLMVQELAYRDLKDAGIQVIPIDFPDHFSIDNPDPGIEAMRQMIGVFSQWQKSTAVLQLRAGRNAKKGKDQWQESKAGFLMAPGKCEGRKSVLERFGKQILIDAKKLRHKNPHTGKVRGYTEIAKELAELGYTQPNGKPLGRTSIKRLLNESSRNQGVPEGTGPRQKEVCGTGGQQSTFSSLMGAWA